MIVRPFCEEISTTYFDVVEILLLFFIWLKHCLNFLSAYAVCFHVDPYYIHSLLQLLLKITKNMLVKLNLLGSQPMSTYKGPGKWLKLVNSMILLVFFYV